MSSSPRPAPPTGYLSLPLELRHQILFESLSHAIEEDFLYINLACYIIACPPMNHRKRSLCHWAWILSSTHKSIASDLDYLLKVKLRDFEIELNRTCPNYHWYGYPWQQFDDESSKEPEKGYRWWSMLICWRPWKTKK